MAIVSWEARAQARIKRLEERAGIPRPFGPGLAGCAGGDSHNRGYGVEG